MKGNRKAAVLALVLSFGAFSGVPAGAECAPVISEEVKVGSRFFDLFFGERETAAVQTAETEEKLIPGGDVFGVRILTGEVRVESVSEERKGDADFPLQPNDVILSIDGRAATNTREAEEAVTAAGERVTVTVSRDGNEYTFDIAALGEEGDRRLGVALSDGAAGIGTVSYYKEDGTFGGLGHPISDSGGRALPLSSGEVTGVILGGVGKGMPGAPGELHGILRGDAVGNLRYNGTCGVFGTVPTPARAAIPVGRRDEVHEGTAVIRSTVKNGLTGEYTVGISEIDRDDRGNKSFTVTVTDEVLLALTGGIVRGMSGSPIIQDGKLIGAVTHVLVSDPTVGYGIFIENMLDADLAATAAAAA